MSRTEKVHERIWAKHSLRVVAGVRDGALVVSDTRREVYRVPTTAQYGRVAWYEEVLSYLDAGGALVVDRYSEYRNYAR